MPLPTAGNIDSRKGSANSQIVRIRRPFRCYIPLRAGLFVCNALLCRLLHEIETHYPQMRGGFVHVPCLPEQAERLGKGKALPSLALPEIVQGLQAALAFCSRLEPDVP